MKNYIIRRGSDASEGHIAKIETYAWEENGYAPETQGRITSDGERLLLFMKCRETNPFRRFTEPYEHVWLDSCMEFFFAVNDSMKYFNFECNANGAYYLCYGTNESDKSRYRAAQILACPPVAKIGIRNWTVSASFFWSEIRKVTGTDKIEYLRGNFYKCGDEAPLPHFGMWSPVTSETPQFHLPEYFRRMDFQN